MKEMKDKERFIVKIDRGFIQYVENYFETNETQYGTTFEVKYAKKYSRVQANRIIKSLNEKGEYAEKVLLKEDE